MKKWRLFFLAFAILTIWAYLTFDVFWKGELYEYSQDSVIATARSDWIAISLKSFFAGDVYSDVEYRIEGDTLVIRAYVKPRIQSRQKNLQEILLPWLPNVNAVVYENPDGKFVTIPFAKR